MTKDNRVHKNRTTSKNNTHRQALQIAAYVTAETGEPMVFSAARTVSGPDFDMLVRARRSTPQGSPWSALAEGSDGRRLFLVAATDKGVMLQDVPVLIRLGDLLKLMKGDR